ncbi:MAG: hypothetical protein V4559_12205 [Pseudomonadota bacterium]
MAKKKLLEDIKANPSRFYRLPGDVVRDRRFDDGERLEILQAWTGEADPLQAEQIGDVIAEVRRRLARNDHAAE